MSLLSNPNINRYGIMQSWNSNWVEYNMVYSTLIYSDIYINEFINGIYYKLKMPTSLPIIRDLGYKNVVIFVKSLIFYKKIKSIKYKHFYLFKRVLKIRHRKILLYFKKILYYIKKLNKDMINNSIDNKIVSIKSLIKLLGKKVLFNRQLNNTFYKFNNKYKNIYSYNKYKYFSNKLNNIFNINYKNKLINKIKHYNLFKKLKKKKNILNIIKLDNTKKLDNIKKLIKYFSIFNIKKKLLLQKLKYKLLRYRKKKLSKMKNNLFCKRIMRNKLFSAEYLLNKPKTYFTMYNNLFIKTNQFYLFFKWLFIKLINIYYFIVLNSVYNKLIFNKIYINISNIYNNINLFFFYNNINYLIIKKNMVFYNNINYNKNNIIKSFLFYKRLKSYYRLKKKKIRSKKKKLFALKYSPSVYTLQMRLLMVHSKWLNNYYKKLYYKQLSLKMNNTLNLYLNKSIKYIHHFNKLSFNRLDNPKLLGDYIKLLMKYEYRNPYILKKIVKIHSKQKLKSKKIARNYANKLYRFNNKINNKLIKFFKFKYSTIKYNNYNTINLKRVTKKQQKYHIKKYKYNYLKNNNIFKKNINNIAEFNLFNSKRFLQKNIFNLKNKNINNFKLNIKLNYHLMYILNTWILKFRNLVYKKYPLIGIRIELSGPTKKGRRTQTHLYNEWVNLYTLPGKMPLVTIMTDVQYWQTYGLTQRAAIGIKVWMFFHTPTYSISIKKLLNKE